MSQKLQPVPKPNLETVCKPIIEYLIQSFYTHPISLNTLQVFDMSVYWQIANFIFKSLDSSILLSCSKDLIDLVKSLNYPQILTSKMFIDDKSWEKLLNVLAWGVRLIRYSPASDFSHFHMYCFQAFKEKNQGNEFHGLTDAYLSNLQVLSKKDQELVERNKEEIAELIEKKQKITHNNPLYLAEERVNSANNELYLEIGRLSTIEEDYKALCGYNQQLWELIRKKLGGRAINNDLILALKQENNEIHVKSINKLTEIVDEQNKLECLREKSEKFNVNAPKEKQLLDLQEKIENVRADNNKLLEEIKGFNIKIADISLDLSGFEAKYRKEHNLVNSVLSEDRQAISKHAQKVAEMLESIDLASYDIY